MIKNRSRIHTFIYLFAYMFFFHLPLALTNLLNDYTFNIALAQLTLTLFIIVSDYDYFTNEFQEFKKLNLIQTLACMSTIIVSLFLLMLTLFTPLKFTSIILPTLSNNMPLKIMELFSIGLCYHINEAYIFNRMASLSSKSHAPLTIILTAIAFIVLNCTLIYFWGYTLSTSIIYYSLIAIVLAFIRYTRKSVYSYFFVFFWCVWLFNLLFI